MDKNKGLLINKVPALLKARGETAEDLHYGARISPTTAKAWAKNTFAPGYISTKVLISLCNYFQCPITGIIEIVTPS